MFYGTYWDVCAARIQLSWKAFLFNRAIDTRIYVRKILLAKRSPPQKRNKIYF